MKFRFSAAIISILIFALCFSSVSVYAEEVPAESAGIAAEAETTAEEQAQEPDPAAEDTAVEAPASEAEEAVIPAAEAPAEEVSETPADEAPMTAEALEEEAQAAEEVPQAGEDTSQEAQVPAAEETSQEEAEQAAEEEITVEAEESQEEETEAETKAGTETETEVTDEDADADLEVADEEQEEKNGFVKVDEQWGWYVKDELQETMSGFVNGTIDDVAGWYYIENGIYTEASGLARRADGSNNIWYYAENGKFAARTGVAPKAAGGDEMYYVQKGVYNSKATGIARRADRSDDDWYYVQNGKYTEASGITKPANGKGSKWYYVENGKFTAATGLCRKADLSDKKYYYVEGGVYNKKYTGLAQAADGSVEDYYFVMNGVFTRATGIVRVNVNGKYCWLYFRSGVFTQATGITRKADHSIDNTYYYVKNGVYRKSTGLAKRADGKSDVLWYVVSGKLNRNYNGGVVYNDTLYEIKSGRASVNYEYTGIVKDGTKYYYFAGGTKSDATGVIKGIVNNTTGWWLVEEGTIDLTRNGSFSSGIRTYEIVNGRAVSCNYYFFDTEIDLPSGGYNVSTNNIGIKVVKINQKVLGVTSAYYTYETASAVMTFQNYNGLPATGVVDLDTWLAMGFTQYDWYNLGTYTTPIKTNGFSTVAQLRNAMIKTAAEYAYAGTSYAAGASGAPGSYVDCSGLIYQCLYSIGINPDTNIVLHAQAAYEYTSQYLAVDGKLGIVVSTNSLKPGDLLFYAHTGDYTVVHVAIYAGDGMIYDSWPGLGVTYRSMYIGGYSVIKAIRPV